MAHSNVPLNITDIFSFGNCAPGQDYPTLSCLPALWLAFFAACVFAALGFGLICIMKLRRCYQISKGRKDVYFNDFEFFARQHQGGSLEAGTSSILLREQWVDIEQRAALYSPNPCAALFRTNTQREAGSTKERGAGQRVLSLSEQEKDNPPSDQEEDFPPTAVPPGWFLESRSDKVDWVCSGGQKVYEPVPARSYPPSYTLADTVKSPLRKESLNRVIESPDLKRRMSMP